MILDVTIMTARRRTHPYLGDGVGFIWGKFFLFFYGTSYYGYNNDPLQSSSVALFPVALLILYYFVNSTQLKERGRKEGRNYFFLLFICPSCEYLLSENGHQAGQPTVLSRIV